ncbi:glucosaminidase domain-containing protein [Bacillus salipaludis]|uniref:glucosaminidase domain-containing protein n=1 Tax=Bacillus salipaludis TaxID=2547811 RepID=UPI002E1DF30E|nr:SH3 domain-containing protein [Bacillus salipaludis]
MTREKKIGLYFIIFLLFLQFLPYQATTALAAGDESNSNEILYGVGTASPTKVFKQPSSSSVVLKSYAQGTILKYQTYSTDWYECTVYINGKIEKGYIKVSDVENILTSPFSFKGIGLLNPTKIYSKASKTSNVLKSYAQGTVLKYKQLTSHWYECVVYINGEAIKGYIYKNDVENLDNTVTALQGAALRSQTNIYSKASTYSSTLKSYSAGTILKYTTFTSGWYECKVYINGKETVGYISVHDVENAVKNPVAYIGMGLMAPTNVYQNASTSSKRLKSYVQGKILKYQSFVTGWYSASIYINGKKTTGYIKSSDVENGTSSPSSLEVWALKDVNVYTYASKNADVLKSYKNGTQLKVQTFTSSWYQATVYINGKAHTGYISASDVTTRPYADLDLRKPANITAQEIVDFFNKKRPDSPLKNYAQNFINVQDKFGVNALYLVAHAIWETGWGGSNLITYKHNLYGYGAYDVCPFTCGYYFPISEDSISTVAYKVRTNYLTPGGPYYVPGYGATLKGMNINYASDQNWKYGIANLMESMKPYDGKYYASAPILSLEGSPPSNMSRDIPSGSPYPTSIIKNFPQGITGEMIESSNLRTIPYVSSSTSISALSAGDKITVLGYNTDVKTNGDYPYDASWYRIAVSGKVGWIYGESIEIANLLQVTGVDSGMNLNIRDQPVDGNIIGSIPADGYIKAVSIDGKPVTQDDWYQVYLPNSTKTGWVSGDYINVIKN